jgi:hypothetical protein
MKFTQTEAKRVFVALTTARTKAYNAFCEILIEHLPLGIRLDLEWEGFPTHAASITREGSLSRLLDQAAQKSLALAEHLASRSEKDVEAHFRAIAAQLIERAASPAYARLRDMHAGSEPIPAARH